MYCRCTSVEKREGESLSPELRRRRNAGDEATEKRVISLGTQSWFDASSQKLKSMCGWKEGPA
jgi:hypothetical protein